MAQADLPSGVDVGGLDRRLVAQLIDVVVPLLLGVAFTLAVVLSPTSEQILVALIAFSVLMLAYGLLLWWMFAARGAGPGMRITKLQLVGVADGKPIGWGRFFLRQLILGACAATGVGLILLVVMLVVNPLRQGWHDQAARSVVITERTKVRVSARTVSVRKPVTSTSVSSMVDLPPHLSHLQGFSGQHESWDSLAEGAFLEQQQAGPISSVPGAVQPSGYGLSPVGYPQAPGPAAPLGPPQSSAPSQAGPLGWGQQPPAATPPTAWQATPGAPGWNPPPASAVPSHGAGRQRGFEQQAEQPSWPPVQQQFAGAGSPPAPPPVVQPPAHTPVPQSPQNQPPQRMQPPRPLDTPQPPVQPGHQPPPGAPQAGPPLGTGPQPPLRAAAPQWGGVGYPPATGLPAPDLDIQPSVPAWGTPAPVAPEAAGSYGLVPDTPVSPPPVMPVEEDYEGTHLARPTGGWCIRMDDGREFAVTGTILIGRNPSPKANEVVAELVSSGADGRMVSKTHVAVGIDQRGVFVMDRGSTNGTAIATASGGFEPCAAGDRVRVRDGQIVSFGDHTLVVRRTTG